MKVYIGNDHSAVDAKNAVFKKLESMGFDVENLGSDSTDSTNYASFGIKVGEKVKSSPGSFGVVICGTGIGISIAANKVDTIRAALIRDVEDAKITREHNDANVLALGARKTSVSDMEEIVEQFFTTEFEGGRHLDRINGIREYEINRNKEN